MPLQATSGAASYDAFGGGVPVVPQYIEDVFSTYLYTGTGALNTINNGIDLSTKGGLVWCKGRNFAGYNNSLMSTAFSGMLFSDATNAASDYPTDINSYNTNGFTLKASTNYDNISGTNYVSWTFRKQPKFFDVVTYTGNGTAGRTVSHNLGSTPACIIVKAYSVDTGDYWGVYHRSLGATKAIFLSATNAAATSSIYWNDTEPTSTNFTVGDWSGVNQNGTSYVAYLFAHDAGGFGLTGTDNVISCGSFTTDGSSNFSATLGYEPQWVMIKRYNTTGNWLMFDNMRGMGVQGISQVLYADVTNAEAGPNDFMAVNSTGFNGTIGSASQSYIYIAIRRGPMKVPTSGTSVFSPVARAGTSATATVTTGFPVDMTIIQDRTQNSFAAPFDRLRGATRRLFTPFTSAEASEATTLTSFAVQNGFTLGTDLGAGFVNTTGDNYINWSFRRAPSFFDEVCYTGTSANGQVINHNLSAIPEMVIIKGRDSNSDWFVYQAGLSSGNSIYLNRNYAQSNDGGPAFSLSTTALTISRTYVSNLNSSGVNYVAYLFATCAGVSKCGAYTGNGSSQTINCGFTGGARFVMVKATSTTGNWIVADSARGIVAGNDPALYLNSTAAEVTGLDWIDADNSGFVVNETATIAANTNGVSYIFLAIA